MWPLDLLQPRRLPVSPLPSPALPSPGSWITRSPCSGATSGHSLGLKDSTAATESRDSPSLHQRGKISPMRRMEGRDQGLALESRWKNQRIWDFPACVFSGRFKGNFWRGFSKNPSRPLVLKRFMGKKSGDGTCIWILNHGLREGRLIQREPGNAPPKHSPGSQIFRGK